MHKYSFRRRHNGAGGELSPSMRPGNSSRGSIRGVYTLLSNIICYLLYILYSIYSLLYTLYIVLHALHSRLYMLYRYSTLQYVMRHMVIYICSVLYNTLKYIYSLLYIPIYYVL